MIYGKADPALAEVSKSRYGRLMYLSNDRYLGGAIAKYGEYSEAEVAFWRELLSPQAIIADVGANIGTHTVALSQIVPQGAVYAFEPLVYLYYALCGNLFLNACTNVKAINAAVGNHAGSLTIPALDYTHQGEDANYGGMNMEGHEVGRPVPLVRLDDICPVIHFIKIDVEGMEQQVIEGAQRLVTQCSPILYVENNPGPNQPNLIRYIQSIGYACWWHHPPHYNPNNYRGAPCEPGLENIVSWNMVCLPDDQKNRDAMKVEPIAKA